MDRLGRLKEPNFQTLDGPTVQTKRNFSLLRGKTIQEAPNVLVKKSQGQNGVYTKNQTRVNQNQKIQSNRGQSPASRKIQDERKHQGQQREQSPAFKKILDHEERKKEGEQDQKGQDEQDCKLKKVQHDRTRVSPPPTPDSGFWSPSSSADNIGSLERSGSMSTTSGKPKTSSDKSTTVWDWPLGEAKVMNGPDCIEAQLNIFPFTAKEVWVTIMGNELVIHCKSENSRPPLIGQRELFRSYTLPLNVNPRTAEFMVVQDRILKIVVKKDKPLKLAIAYYGPDSDEGELDTETISSRD